MGNNRACKSAIGVLVGVGLLTLAFRFIRALFGTSADDEDPHPGEDRASDQHADALGDGGDGDPGALHNVGPEHAEDNAASEHFFGLWLDASMMLSSARFDDEIDEDVDLTIAQRRMMDSIAERLALQPGMRVLVIESGWGYFALYLAEHYGVQVTGYSRQAARVASARRRADEAEPGVGPRDVQFVHGEVSQVVGTFHRIIRIALSEIETPVPEDLYFDLLEYDGQALVHATTSPLLVHSGADPRFDIEREDITDSFDRTLCMWSENLDARSQEGQLVLFEARAREWQNHLERLSVEIENGTRCLDQVVYTKLPLSPRLGGRAASRGVERRHDGGVVGILSNPDHPLPVAT